MNICYNCHEQFKKVLVRDYMGLCPHCQAVLWEDLTETLFPKQEAYV